MAPVNFSWCIGSYAVCISSAWVSGFERVLHCFSQRLRHPEPCPVPDGQDAWHRGESRPANKRYNGRQKPVCVGTYHQPDSFPVIGWLDSVGMVLDTAPWCQGDLAGDFQQPDSIGLFGIMDRSDHNHQLASIQAFLAQPVRLSAVFLICGRHGLSSILVWFPFCPAGVGRVVPGGFPGKNDAAPDGKRLAGCNISRCSHLVVGHATGSFIRFLIDRNCGVWSIIGEQPGHPMFGFSG